jgi:hypothetical protein
MTDFTPQNPPRNLRRYACPRCKCDLGRIKEEGCMSLHKSAKPECNATGWGSLHKPEKEAA